MQAEMLGLFAAVQNQDNTFTAVPMESGEYQQFISSQQEFQFTVHKNRTALAENPQFSGVFEQVFILVAPWEAAAVEWVFPALQADFVPVVNTRNARQEELQYHGSL